MGWMVVRWIRGRRFWFPAVLALYALLTYAAAQSAHGPLHLSQLTEEQRALETQVRTLLSENADLKERIRRLHTDDVFLEKIAREDLLLVREHEIVYRFRDPAKPPQSPR